MRENFNLIFKEEQIKEDSLLRLLIDKKFRLLRHLISFLCLLSLMLSGKNWGEFYGIYDHLDWISSVLFMLLVFYVNMYILIPTFLYNSKALIYLLNLFLIILAGSIILLFFKSYVLENHRLIQNLNFKNSIQEIFLVTFFLIPIFLFSSGLKLFQHWMYDTEKFYELKKKSIESELIALRSQIQPHFLFNMLNNINILTRKDPEKASFIIVKLSEFLRYLLYENSEEKVTIVSEIKFIHNYLSLEKMRRDDFEYVIDSGEENIKHLNIPPHLILILIENAIKHSADTTDESYVDVVFTLEAEYLKIRVTNSVPLLRMASDSQHGVGLTNLQRRLELIYKDSFTLNASRNKDEYIAILKIPV
ncbi:Histidine kinase [Paenimyroides ummariense]|uniref:Histidine kinase n=1 Tax=Paenimyroides ummariense TaxID=913024 RepID=A0A1I5CSF7_9FLAO|nr:histidine kinase [Paenimyroides ummariense]SFN89874.1 Histidine kinase [Paenimyroides ummariense]